MFRGPRESADSRETRAAPGDEFILAGSPGAPREQAICYQSFFFLEVSDSDLRLSRFIAKLGNEIMYTIK